MSVGLTCDEGLVHHLPLPLAKLYRRAHNARSPLDRHQASFYLWEVSLRMLASSAIITYAEGAATVPELDHLLRRLARPLLSDWWEFVRRLVPALAEAGDAGF